MQVQGRIAQSSEGTFEGWDLTQEIPELDVYDVRYSRGFLRAPFDAWFGDVRADWQPLAERLGIELENFSLRRGFVFPENVGRVVPVEFGGEIGVIGLEDASANALLRVFGSGVDESAEDLLLEYLERRLLSTLSAVWRSDTQFTTSYLAPDEVESVEIVGVLTVHCTFGGNPLSVHFGLGPRMLEFFDLRHRREFVASQLLDSDALDSETVELSVELVELNVEPAMLVDYMRSGTAISLDLPRSH
ncbi:MAG: hypothetical protein KDD44_12115, partial [Bdellovibrionales bacterium]|nr:hypothetical protein [Bdellovibrionales bacterium]